MSIYSGIYSVYEKLASAKMNAMVTAINAHTHDGTYGTKLSFTDIDGTITITQLGGIQITGGMIANNSINTNHIVNSTIQVEDIDLTSIHLSADGYAVYAP